eukprot:Tbor_TRINITY_DN6147_c2_g2::TRINITY_DN6147_c2_g2_i1::g.22105::m.22105/K19753/LRRC6; protein TilB
MRITIDLLRKRAEHNEGCLSDLKEIALHQQDIERLEVVGDTCRQLEILYLCNNYIPKIEGLTHLKRLTYLNLAVNNITIIEGLEGCECLEKLDLTLNFVADIDCVVVLRKNIFLATLHMTGNPCTKTIGYRAFVAHALPQLDMLDSEEISKSERIKARQATHEVAKSVIDVSEKEVEKERIKEEMIKRGIDPFPPKYNEKGDRVYGHTPEERLQILRAEQEEKKKRENQPKAPNSIGAIHDEINKKPIPMTVDEEMEKYGRLLLRNEGKVKFDLNEDDKKHTILTVNPGKYISTTLIEIDLQPKYVRIFIKGKLLQLTFQREVLIDSARVERSQVTGELKLTLPVEGASNRMRQRFDVEEAASESHTSSNTTKNNSEKENEFLSGEDITKKSCASTVEYRRHVASENTKDDELSISCAQMSQVDAEFKRNGRVEELD